ncbi:threonine/serine exporter family protein [Citricoccus sp.]|uniref:threonine/serine ThrE exporter family protein n=1 Tax=Citricoccus sp. TaxID=1978372 RepID=UPI0028BE5EE2|nr:threonine/serine exporter family protein [Citricoccus sp.]
MEKIPEIRTGYRHAQEPPADLAQIPIIKPTRRSPEDYLDTTPDAGDEAEPEAAPAPTSAIDFALGPAAEAAGLPPTGGHPTAPPPAPSVETADPVRTDSGTTVVGGPTAPGGDAGVGPADASLTDTPLTEPPASDPVPQSVLAPSDPTTGETPETAPIGTTGTVGVSEREKKPSKGRLRFSGGSAFKRMMFSEPLPTQSLAIVNRIAISPYANPYLRTTRNAEADARTTLDFALKLGETMFRFGAGALEVETSIIVVTQAFGIHETEVDITNQSIALNYAPSGKTPYSLHRVVRSWSQNYAGLALLHRLVAAVAAGEMDRDEAQQTLADIRHKPKPFPGWLTTVAAGLFSATFVVFIGGGVVGAGVAFLSMMLMMTVVDLLGRARIPEFFSIMAGGFIATMIALVLYTLDVDLAPSLVVAGGIMLLLPSGRFVSAVQDAINGFPVTAAGRFVSAFLVFAALIGGIVAATVFASMLGVRELDLVQEPFADYPVWLLGILVFAAATWNGIFEQSEWRLLLPTAVVSLTGYAVYVGAEFIGVGSRLTPAIAAVAIGALGRYVALRMGAPQLVVAVPGILFLLPGLTIFRSMYKIAMDTGQMMEGVIGLFNAAVVIMAIAAGVVLGDTIARPFTTAFQANERRRIGRR